MSIEWICGRLQSLSKQHFVDLEICEKSTQNYSTIST